MRVLIAILSCERDRPLEEALRQTCYKDSDLRRFFLGGPATASDHVSLDVPDTYDALPLKTKAMCAWAIENGYDRLFKCDTDTYVHLVRLLSSGLTGDYSGYYRGPGPSYASGGSGYWLSRRAMEIVANSPMALDYTDPRGYIHGEDLQVGRFLLQAGIECNWDERYQLHRPIGESTITLHDVRNPMKTPQAVFDTHKEFTA